MHGRGGVERLDFLLDARAHRALQFRRDVASFRAASLFVDEAHEDDRECFDAQVLERSAEEQLRELHLEAVDQLRDVSTRCQGAAVQVPELVEEREVPVEHAPLVLLVLVALLLGAVAVLELVERLLPRFGHAIATETLDEVQDRAERQLEAAFDRFRATGHQALDRRFDQVALGKQRENETFLVEALTSRTTRHLHVIAGREVVEADAVELAQRVEDHGARRHVDPERERLRREEHLHEARREHAFDDFLVHGQHAGVVIADAAPRHRHDLALEESRVERERAQQIGLQCAHGFALARREQFTAFIVARQSLAVLAAERKDEDGQ